MTVPITTRTTQDQSGLPTLHASKSKPIGQLSLLIARANPILESTGDAVGIMEADVKARWSN
jgi:hypothetical protein